MAHSDRRDFVKRLLLVPNRVGYSWMHKMMGGSLICSADGEVLASANRQGREEILHHNLEVETA